MTSAPDISRARFDVIVWPETESDLQEQMHGIDRRFSPLAYTKTPEFPTHGTPDASDDITGGIGWEGLAQLQRFVERGGLLVTLGNGSSLALDGGLVRGASRASGGGSVWTPGVELRTKFLRADHPIAYGYPAVDSVFRGSFPVYAVRPADRGWVVLQWGTKPPKEDREPADAPAEPSPGGGGIVVSGGAKGEDVLEGRPRDSGHPGGERPRDRVQLQPDAPRPEPVGLPAAVERVPELARAPEMRNGDRSHFSVCLPHRHS